MEYSFIHISFSFQGLCCIFVSMRSTALLLIAVVISADLFGLHFVFWYAAANVFSRDAFIFHRVRLMLLTIDLESPSGSLGRN